ncbi:MAG TPA: hypothetical protein VN226_04545 [Anaerolineales bacterium]|nr:hypothetical protein [Anaerolineales bacterium]
MTDPIEIGKLLRAGTAGFVVGCSVAQFDQPRFGALVRVPVTENYEIFGVIQNIRIDDDGLVRQLVSSAAFVSDEILRDNRERRIVPVEMSVLSVGYMENGKIWHMLPPQPALSLEKIYLCDEKEIALFTSGEGIRYLRHLLRADDAPIPELIASHIAQVEKAHSDPQAWVSAATSFLIQQLRDDHSTLMSVLNALSEIFDGTDLR